jgi:ABC-type nickel/cobalt efflux system permease component RcnA
LAWAFASALLQATVAVALVAFLSALLRATAITMGFTVDLVELVSYALIMLIGLRLLFVKGRGLFAMLRQVSPLMFQVGAAITPLPYYHHANCDDRHNRAAQPHDTPHAEGGRKHHREYGGPATYHAHVPRPVELARVKRKQACPSHCICSLGVPVVGHNPRAHLCASPRIVLGGRYGHLHDGRRQRADS